MQALFVTGACRCRKLSSIRFAVPDITCFPGLESKKFNILVLISFVSGATRVALRQETIIVMMGDARREGDTTISGRDLAADLLQITVRRRTWPDTVIY
jgi:hypothetical protein